MEAKMTQENSKNPFINDNSIDLFSHEDLLNTSAYVDSLYNIVQSTTTEDETTPLTIGLTGKWGAGKSTIINTLKTRINNDKSRNKMLVYDAWKFDANAFRRDFLCYLNNELNNAENNIHHKLYKNKDHFENITAKETKWNKKQMIIFGVLFVLSLSLATITASNTVNFNPISIIVFTVLYATISQTLVSAFIEKSVFISYQTVQDEKIFSSEQFFCLFNEILENARSRNDKKDYYIISIDNIDRLQNNQHEILSTIKIFLESKHCSFIIPYDGEKLLYGDENREEFIRKYFSITLAMRSYNDEDLYEFAYKTLTKTNQYIQSKNVNDIAQLLSDEFFNNPRQITCFINNLFAEIFLAHSLENNGQIPKGAITSNLLYLSKYLLIKNRFFHILLVKKNPSAFIRMVEENIQEGETIISNMPINNTISKSDYDALTNFFIRNRNISLSNPNHYKYFSILTDRLILYPENLLEYILSTDFDNIKKLFTENFEEKDFIEFISNQLRLRSSRSVPITNIIHTVIISLCDVDFSLTDPLMQVLNQYVIDLFDSELEDIPLVNKFDVALIAKELRYSNWFEQIKNKLNSTDIQFVLTNRESIQHLFSNIDSNLILNDFTSFLSHLLKLGPKHFNHYIEYVQGRDLSDYFNNEILSSSYSCLDLEESPKADKNKLAIFIILNLENYNVDQNIVKNISNEIQLAYNDISFLQCTDEIDQKTFNLLKCTDALIEKSSINGLVQRNVIVVENLLSLYKKSEFLPSSFKGLHSLCKKILQKIEVINEKGFQKTQLND